MTAAGTHFNACDTHVTTIVALQMNTQTYQSPLKSQAEQKSQVRVQCIASSNP